MHKQNLPVVIATTVFAKKREDVRVQFAFQTVEKATALGIPIVVVFDGDWNIAEALREAGALVYKEVDHKSGQLGPGRRQAIQIARDLAGPDGVVCWMEPEKVDLVRSISQIVQPILEGTAQMVVPTRASVSSLPSYQAFTEMLGCWIMKTALGRDDLDFFFGPVAFDYETARFFLEYDGRLGDTWDSIHASRIMALAAGVTVIGLVVDYIHPATQTAEEEGELKPKFDDKRRIQFFGLIYGLWKLAWELGVAKVQPPFPIE